MPIVFDAKEKTALATSVVADERQSVQNTDNIIPTTDEHFNDSGEIYEENFCVVNRYDPKRPEKIKDMVLQRICAAGVEP